ncbi:MAG: hypothetical protein JEZ07_13525 [Phycisphaerae bacterium]|nr:hypothetical protein [Phycisphaerae bacterium]
MKIGRLIVVLLLVLGVELGAGVRRDGIEIEMSVKGANEPSPALKYSLMFEYSKRHVGNAALGYLMTDGLGYDEEPDDMPESYFFDSEDDSNWWYGQLKEAAMCDNCDWSLPIREKGHNTTLPHLMKIRKFGKQLVIKADMEISKGEINQAIETITVGLALAKHTASDCGSMGNYTGIRIAHLMFDQLERLMSLENCPNLYWAIAGIDNNMFNLVNVADIDRNIIAYSFPAFKQLQAGELNEMQAMELANDVNELLNMVVPLGGERVIKDTSKMAMMMRMTTAHDYAKKFLLASGYTKDYVDNLPLVNAVMLFYYEEYQQVEDDMKKWYRLPFVQAYGRIIEESDKLAKHCQESKVKNPLLMTLGLSHREYEVNNRIRRRYKALQVIEAIRDYLATEGCLPEKLTQIKNLPTSDDPATEKPFVYKKISDGKATLTITKYDEYGKDRCYVLNLGKVEDWPPKRTKKKTAGFGDDVGMEDLFKIEDE